MWAWPVVAMCINGSKGVNIFAYNDKDADSAAFIELSELRPANKTTWTLFQYLQMMHKVSVQ